MLGNNSASLYYDCTLWNSEEGPHDWLALKLFGDAQLSANGGHVHVNRFAGAFHVVFPRVFLPAQVEEVTFRVGFYPTGAFCESRIAGKWRIFFLPKNSNQ